MTNSNQILFFITIIITYLKGQNVNNPCPNIFRYARDSINGEIMGFLRIPASVQQLQYTVKFKTTVPVKLNSVSILILHNYNCVTNKTFEFRIMLERLKN